LRERFELILEETSRKHGLPPAAMESAVRFAYLRWLCAQQKPPTMPPSA